MKAILYTIAATLLLASLVGAATTQKISIDARGLSLEETMKQISTQSGASIVIDPKAHATVTLNLSDSELPQALDAITKTNNLIWKKLQFAKAEDTTVKLDQLKSTVLALSSIPMVAMCVQDPATKTNVMFAKDMPTSPDASVIALPQGYSWTTVYVILTKDVPEDTAAKPEDKVQAITEAQSKLTMELANMTPEQRQQCYANDFNLLVTLTPEVRAQMFRDRMSAMHNLDPAVRDQLRQGMPNRGGGGGGGDHNNHNQDQNQN